MQDLIEFTKFGGPSNTPEQILARISSERALLFIKGTDRHFPPMSAALIKAGQILGAMDVLTAMGSEDYLVKMRGLMQEYWDNHALRKIEAPTKKTTLENSGWYSFMDSLATTQGFVIYFLSARFFGGKLFGAPSGGFQPFTDGTGLKPDAAKIETLKNKYLNKD